MSEVTGFAAVCVEATQLVLKSEVVLGAWLGLGLGLGLRLGLGLGLGAGLGFG